MEARGCPSCGRPIDDHNRHVRFQLPDPVLSVPPDERARRTWGDDPLIQVDGVGAFVRVLLPIQLTDGFTLTLGTWIAVDPSTLRSIWERWDTVEYSTLQLDGYLANAVPPWGEDVLGAPITASVGDPSQFPYVRSSSHPVLGHALTSEWPHDVIFDAYASAL